MFQRPGTDLELVVEECLSEHATEPVGHLVLLDPAPDLFGLL
jgi:hypothetical protein